MSSSVHFSASNSRGEDLRTPAEPGWTKRFVDRYALLYVPIKDRVLPQFLQLPWKTGVGDREYFFAESFARQLAKDLSREYHPELGYEQCHCVQIAIDVAIFESGESIKIFVDGGIARSRIVFSGRPEWDRYLLGSRIDRTYFDGREQDESGAAP